MLFFTTEMKGKKGGTKKIRKYFFVGFFRRGKTTEKEKQQVKSIEKFFNFVFPQCPGVF